MIANQRLYVSFDHENANDESGRNNHGTIQGDVKFVDGIKGKAAHIVNENGSTMSQALQYINFGQPSDLKFGTDDFAISFWYKTENGGGNEAAIISNKDWSTGANLGFTIGNFKTTSRMNFAAVQGKRIDINNIKINDDKWHYVVMNADRDNKLSAYVDGEYYDSKDISLYYQNSIDAEDFVIGADGLKTQGINDAYIDEVRVFGRLMSEQEMETQYLPVKLDMLIKQGETALEQAKTSGYPQSKIAAFEAVIQEVKEAQTQGDATKNLIERMENAYDYFMIEEDAQLTFHVFSDVHITENNRNSENSANFINALQDLKDLSPNSKAVVIPGDLTNGGSEAQYEGFFDIIDHFMPDGSTPIIALGNHDVRWLCSNDDRNEASLTNPTCKEGTSPFKDRYLKGNQKYMGNVPQGQLYFDTWIEGYHFITLNTEKDLKDQAYLSAEQLQWLDQKMAEQADPEKPIFVQIHQTFQGTADHEELDWVGEQEEELKAILSKYPQSVIFTGHVHNGVDLLSVYQGTWGHLVDVPCYWYKSYGSMDTQGIAYQVDVNGTEVSIRVRDFINNSWLDSYEMNFDITDPMPKDPSDASHDLPIDDMQVSAGSTHAGDDPINVLDNDDTTIWYSEWTGSTVELNYLLFDLNGMKRINGLRYLPRQNSMNGTITKYRIQISDNGTDFTTVAEGDWKENKNWKMAEFETVSAAYVKLIALKAPNANGNDAIASAAEVRLTQPEPVDRSDLERALTEADEILKQNDVYTAKSLRLYQTEVDKAIAIYNDPALDETAIENAMQILEHAKQLLVVLPNLSELMQLIKEADALQEDTYTKESWAIFAKALEEAKTVYNQEDATQDQVNNAADALQAAMSGLQKQPEKIVNKVPLEKEIHKAEALKADDFTEESWLVLLDALAHAKAVYEDETLDQATIDQEVIQLQNAIKNLVKLPDHPEKPRPDDVHQITDENEMVTAIGKFPVNVKLHADPLDKEAMVRLLNRVSDRLIFQRYKFESILDIYMTRNNVLYQPDGAIIVQIKLNKEDRNKKLHVFYISETGELTEMSSTQQGDVLQFTTKHFSHYAIVSEKTKENPIKDTATQPFAGTTFITLLSGGVMFFLNRRRSETMNESE